MRYYIDVVHQEGDSAYGVHFPDIARCFSEADEMDDLLVNASEAIALHLEGKLLPNARSLDVVRADSEVVQDLAEGAFLLAVPVIQLTGRSAKDNITIDAELLAAVNQTAEEYGLTRSVFLADLAKRETAG